MTWKRPASIVLPAAAFAAAGALSRYTFRMTETRYQIAAFVGAAVALELIVAGTRMARTSLLRGVLNAGAATLVIVLVKFHLEPASRAADATLVHHAVRSVARDAHKVG